MASSKQKIHDIIDVASIACNGIGGGLAQEAESEAIVAIQTTMIIAIASEHGTEISNADAVDLLHTFSATARSGQIPSSRQAFVVGWLPGVDNVINDSKASAITQAIGWAANSHFDPIEAKLKA